MLKAGGPDYGPGAAGAMLRIPAAAGGASTMAGTFALIACNVAGLIDLVALPLWVGALIASRGYTPAMAGLTVTSYLLGLLCSSLLLAPRFDRLSARPVASAGFALGALAFGAMPWVAAPAALAGVHILAGVGAGCGLSATHGTIGRAADPHRVFGLANLGVCVFAIAFFATAPSLIAAYGAGGLFLLLGMMLLIASLVSAAAFPDAAAGQAPAHAAPAAKVPLLAVLAFVAVACSSIIESMVFSTAQSIGLQRGFTLVQIGHVLLIGGLINLTAPLAAISLQKFLPPFLVSGAAIALHGCMACLVTVLGVLAPWGAALIAMVWLILFGQNFTFGVIARLDPSGRTTASMPAMLMTGAAVGPALGGVLAQSFGYGSLGAAALIIASAGTACLAALWRQSRLVTTQS